MFNVNTRSARVLHGSESRHKVMLWHAMLPSPAETANKRSVSRSHDHFCPSEARIKVARSLMAHQRPVSRSRDQSRPIRDLITYSEPTQSHVSPGWFIFPSKLDDRPQTSSEPALNKKSNTGYITISLSRLPGISKCYRYQNYCYLGF